MTGGAGYRLIMQGLQVLLYTIHYNESRMQVLVILLIYIEGYEMLYKTSTKSLDKKAIERSKLSSFLR